MSAGNSLATKTDVIKQVTTAIEGSGRKLAGVHSKIGEHAPIAGIHSGVELLKKYASEGDVGLSEFVCTVQALQRAEVLSSRRGWW